MKDVKVKTDKIICFSRDKMQNPKVPVEKPKNYPYDYKYGSKRQIPLQKHNLFKNHKQRSKQPDILYEPSASNSSNKSNLEEELSNYEQPTLPYYVVPVLYVPKRVLPNDEIQPTANYRPQTRPSANPKTKYYTKNYEPNEYGHVLNNYYQKRNEGPHEPALEDEMSYYNMQFCDSSRSVKEDAFESNFQDFGQPDQAYGFIENKTPSENIKPLKSQPLCQNYNPDKKNIKTKTRSSYECTDGNPGLDSSEYYYMDKELYYSDVRNNRNVPKEPPIEYCYYQQDLASDYDYDDTTHEGSNSQRPKNTFENNTEPKIKAHEKLEVNQKKIFERSTQTLPIQLQNSTISTQTDEIKVKEERNIPVTRNKCNLVRENNNADILDEADKELVDTLYKLQALKQSRRSTSKKKDFFPEQRLNSPGRRKF